MIGGSTLILWKPEKILEIKDEDLCWAFQFKQTGSNKALILIDPWAENSSIWEIEIEKTERRKISDFDSYKNKEFTEKIDW